jgi:hypothetical protein
LPDHASDASGWSALAGARRLHNRDGSGFGTHGKWLSATERGGLHSFSRFLYHGTAPVYRNYSFKQNAHTIRCVRDAGKVDRACCSCSRTRCWSGSPPCRMLVLFLRTAALPHKRVHSCAALARVYGIPPQERNSVRRADHEPCDRTRIGPQTPIASFRPSSRPECTRLSAPARRLRRDQREREGASYRMSERLQLNASIENLMDKNFVDYRPYTLRNNPNVTAFSNVCNNILEPRRLWVALRASL